MVYTSGYYIGINTSGTSGVLRRVYVRYTSGIALVSLTLTKAIETVDTLDA